MQVMSVMIMSDNVCAYCLVMTNPVDILAVWHVKQGIEAEGFRTGHPSNYYLLLSSPNIK